MGFSAEAMQNKKYFFSNDKCSLVGKYGEKVLVQRCENSEVVCYINAINGNLSCFKKEKTK